MHEQLTASIEDRYGYLLTSLQYEREQAGRGEKARWLSIAITELESSLLRYEGAQEKGE